MKRSIAILAWCVVHLLQVSYAEIVEFTLVFTRGNVSPDGYTKSGLLVNGEFPGPTLSMTAGDIAHVTVVNKMLESEVISIHFHGVTSANSWMDGAAGVTNCPLTSGGTFKYVLPFPTEGTYWYHTHAADMRAEGSYGIVVVAPKRPLPEEDYDGVLTMIIGDWYHKSVHDINAGLLQNGAFSWAFNGKSILVNGKGACAECPSVTTQSTTTTTYPNGATSSSSCTAQQEVLSVMPNKKYIIHIVNAASLAYYNLAIAGHQLTVIGADNSTLQHFTTSSVDINSGSRLRVILKTSAAPMAYKIRVQTDWRGTDNSNAGVGYALLAYNGDTTSVSSAVPQNEVRVFDEWLKLLRASSTAVLQDPCPQSASKQVLLVPIQQWVNMSTGLGLDPPLQSAGTPGTQLSWTTYNNGRLVKPKSNFLIASYMDQLDATVAAGGTMGTPASSPLRVELGQVVDIVIQNTVAGNGVCEQHPWHLHGNEFYLVGSGSGKFDPVESPKSYNLVNPARLDSTTVYPSDYGNPRDGTHTPGTWQAPCGWIALRFTGEMPGMHLFHCHIDWHMVMGMGMVFDVASEAAGSPPADYGLCGNISPVRFAAIDQYKRGSTISSGPYKDKKQAGLIAATCTLGALTAFFLGLWWKAMQARDRALIMLTRSKKQLSTMRRDTIPMASLASIASNSYKSSPVKFVNNPIQENL